MALAVLLASLASDLVAFVLLVSLVRTSISQRGLLVEREISHKGHKGHQGHKEASVEEFLSFPDTFIGKLRERWSLHSTHFDSQSAINVVKGVYEMWEMVFISKNDLSGFPGKVCESLMTLITFFYVSGISANKILIKWWRGDGKG